MKKGKRLTTPQRILRFGAWLLLGVIVGGLSGYLIATTNLQDNLGFFNAYTLSWLVRILVLSLFVFSIISLYQTRHSYQQYQTIDEEDDELGTVLYPRIFRHLERAMILNNLVGTLVLFNICLNLKFYTESNGATLTIPIFDYSCLLLVVVLQVASYKMIQKIRHYKLSAFPTVNEIKDYMYSLDEGEQQANFEQAFVTVFNLNQRLLPALYVLVFFIEVLSQTEQLAAYVIILVVHIYINLMQYNMVRRYFR